MCIPPENTPFSIPHLIALAILRDLGKKQPAFQFLSLCALCNLYPPKMPIPFEEAYSPEPSKSQHTCKTVSISSLFFPLKNIFATSALLPNPKGINGKMTLFFSSTNRKCQEKNVLFAIRLSWAICFFLLLPSQTSAQDSKQLLPNDRILIDNQLTTFQPNDSSQTKKEKNHSLFVFPSIGLSPETDWYFGGVANLVFPLYQTSKRKSVVKTELIYSLRNQTVFDFFWNLFGPNDAWISQGKVRWSQFPDFYYGAGADTPESNEIHYNSDRITVDVAWAKRLKGQWFLGPEFRYILYGNLDNLSDDRALDEVYPELTGSSVVGYGLELLFEGRTYLMNPLPKDQYFKFDIRVNHSEGEAYLKSMAEYRFYRKLWKNAVWANQAQLQYTGDGAPFYDQSIYGGDLTARAYYFGRYRDNGLYSYQSEIRSQVYRKWGATVFAGLGNVFDQELSTPLWNGGIGIRFLLDEEDRVNLRFDYAIGENGQQGFYISFGEAF